MDDASSDFTITFTYTVEDQMRRHDAMMTMAQSHVSKGLRSSTSTIFFTLIAALAGCALLLILTRGKSIPLFFVIPFAFLVLALPLAELIPRFLLRRSRRTLASRMVPMQRRITLGSDGITVGTDKGNTVLNWRTIQKIMRDKRDLRIMMGPLAQFTIPLHAFAPGQADQFEAEMMRLWGFHRNDATAVKEPAERANPEFTLTWQSQVDDYINAVRPKRRSIWSWFGRILPAVIGVAIAIWHAASLPTHGHRAGLTRLQISSVIAPIIFIGLTILSSLWKPRIAVGSTTPFGSGQSNTVSIAQSGFGISTYGTISELPWNLITTIDSVDGFVIFRRDKLPLAIVPDRAFLDAEHRQAFIAAAEAYRTGQPAPPYTMWPPAPGR